MTNLMLFLEAGYYLSTMVLLVVAIIGLKQLKISRENAKITATRESLKLANSQIHYYLTEIIKLQDLLFAEIDRLGIKLFDKAEVHIKDNSIKVNLKSAYKEREKIKDITCLLDVFNAMESFSSFFTSGVADETTAFSSIGKTYCNTIKTLMPILIILAPGGFTNIFKLFLLWNNRIEEQKLQDKKRNIENELSRIDNKIIYPLGTK